MPKRSNEFQRLIRRIYSQVAPAGATVEESAILHERGSGTAREVDVLVEVVTADVPVRMAVECRDRGRPADVEWVDQLIGKFRDLSVHRVVAVSRSGFTVAAAEKAKSNNIETRTLVEALGTDWSSKFYRVDIARISARVEPITFEFDTVPAWADATQPVGVVIDGLPVSADDWLTTAIHAMQAEVPDVVKARHGNDWQHLAELGRPTQMNWQLQAPNTEFISHVGSAHAVRSVFVHCNVHFEHSPLSVRREVFGNIGVVSASAEGNLGRYGIMLVQQPNGVVGEAVVFKEEQ